MALLDDRIVKLNAHPKLTCSSCGTIIDNDTDQLRKAVDEIERNLAKQRNSLDKLAKR